MNMILLKDVQENQQLPRIPIRRNIKSNFVFAAFIYAGYDLAPDKDANEFEGCIEVGVGHCHQKLSSVKKGRNPIWNEKIVKLVELDENLEFASNVIIGLSYKKKMFLDFQKLFSTHLGEVCISALNCKTDQDPMEKGFQPNFNFYNFKLNGEKQGRILAAFYLYK